MYFRESGGNPEQFRCCIQGGDIHYATGRSIYSYSAVITMLCNLGLVGTFYYAYIITNLTNRYFDTKFTCYFSIIIIVLLHLLTGHLSYILYLDRIAFLYLVLKYISISKRKNLVLKKDAIVSKNNIDNFGTCNN